jgi:SWIM/SEC-C metal-binding protein
MAKLGTAKHPVVLRIKSLEQSEELIDLCEKNGWKYIIGIEPDKPEDISDLHRLLNPTQPMQSKVRIGRNDPCPCGSGKKV